MKASRSIATGVTVVLVCFVGGFGLGRSGGVHRGAPVMVVDQGEPFARQRALAGEVMAAEIGELSGLFETVSREVPDAAGGAALREGIIERWGAADPGGLLGALLDNRPRRLGESMANICSQAVLWDAGKAWEIGLANPAPAQREAVMLALLEAMLDNGDAVAGVGRALSAPGVDLAVVKAGLRRLAAERPAEAFELARALPRAAVDRGFYGRVIEAISTLDPAVAEGLLATISDRSLHLEATRGLFRGLVARDYERARVRASLQPSAVLRDGALHAVLGVQLEVDPASAAVASAGIASPHMRRQIAAQIAAGWYANDPDATMAWVRGELAGGSASAALEAILDRYGEGLELDEQRRIAVAIGGAGAGRRRFVARWVLEQPQAALRWAAAQPGDAGEALVGAGFGRWLSHDFASAVRYIDVVADPRLKRVLGELLESYRGGGGDGG